MVADTPIEEKTETLGNTISDVNAKPSTRWLTPYNRRRARQTSVHFAM